VFIVAEDHVKMKTAVSSVVHKKQFTGKKIKAACAYDSKYTITSIFTNHFFILF